MNYFPQALFTAGTIMAISGGAKVPEAGRTWPSTWPIFAAGMVLAAVGIVLWRMQRSKARDAAAESADGDPFVLLAAVIEPAKQLQSDIGGLSAPVICKRVDALLDEYILPFAEVRQRVIDRLGMAKGAEILVTVAFAERMLNRVWSAAGDGHLPEANAVLPDAVAAFIEAQAMVEAA